MKFGMIELTPISGHAPNDPTLLQSSFADSSANAPAAAGQKEVLIHLILADFEVLHALIRVEIQFPL